MKKASLKDWFDGDTMIWQLILDGEPQHRFFWSTNEAKEWVAQQPDMEWDNEPSDSHLRN